MEVVTLRFRPHRAWCVVDRNPACFGGEAPQPYFHRFERRHKRESPAANLLRKNNKGLMGEEAVATSLSQSFAPVRQLALKRAGAGPGNLSKRFGIRKALQRKSLPRYDVQISDPVAIDRYLSGERKRCLAASPMNIFGLPGVCPHEGNREPILGGRNPFSAGKVVPRFAEFQLRHRYQRLAHVHAPVRLVSIFTRGPQEPRIPPRRAATSDRWPLPFLRLPEVFVSHFRPHVDSSSSAATPLLFAYFRIHSWFTNPRACQWNFA